MDYIDDYTDFSHFYPIECVNFTHPYVLPHYHLDIFEDWNIYEPLHAIDDHQ